VPKKLVDWLVANINRAQRNRIDCKRAFFTSWTIFKFMQYSWWDAQKVQGSSKVT